MRSRTRIFFIGWDYHSPVSTPLKRLLEHPLSPWEAAGIVHDETWVPAVDGIPLMTTRRFLELCQDKSQEVLAVLKIKHEFHRKVWQRRAKEYGFNLLDEGEIFLATEAQLRESNEVIDLHVVQLSGDADATSIAALRGFRTSLHDARSNAVMHAYIQYLETGLLDPLRECAIAHGENPLCVPATPAHSWVSQRDRGLAWEIAPRRSSFLDQTVLLAGGRARNWEFAFSSEDAEMARREATNLSFVFRPLGFAFSASTVHFRERFRQEQCSETLPPPQLNGQDVICRIDADQPMPLIDAVRKNSARSYFQIRVGKFPRQLADLLREFEPSQIRIECDRPGPLGIQVDLQIDRT